MATEAEPNQLQGHMTLMEHIGELRKRILRSLYAIAIGSTIAWFLYQPILNFLIDPLKELAPKGANLQSTLVTLDPLEPFAIRIKLTVYVGVMLAMPVILWQLWRFIAPGLYSNEKKWAIWFVAVGSLLFFMGAAIAFWTVPKALEWLKAIGGNNFTQFYAPDKYLRLIVYMMLAFGLGFEFPIVVVFLQLIGVVNSRQLRDFRRFAVVIITVIAAVITPSTDPYSMLALAIPMWFFYEVSIVIGRIRERRIRKAAAAAARATPETA
jgi:sec-independent protein translocase protein TatC